MTPLLPPLEKVTFYKNGEKEDIHDVVDFASLESMIVIFIGGTEAEANPPLYRCQCNIAELEIYGTALDDQQVRELYDRSVTSF